MPSKSPAQARLMQAVAHGWKPNRIKGPSRAVAQEFVEADKKYSGGFAENRYWTGGLAAMNEINSGVPVTLSFQGGGEVKPLTGSAAMAAALNPSGDNLRAIDLSDFSSSGMGGTFRSLMEKSLEKQGFYAGENSIWYPATETFTSGGGDPAASLAELTPLIRGDATETNMPVVIPGAAGTAEPVQQTFAPSQTPEERAAQTAAARQSKYRDQLREHKSRVAAALNPSNAARGGYMNYQEGGAVPQVEMRPGLGGKMVGHAEGPNPYAKHIDTHPQMYDEWERRNHRDPAPIDGEVEPAIILPEEEEAGSAMDWLKDMLGIGDDSGITNRSARELEAMGEARGGYMRGYQQGGLARVAPPVGGVPPWVEPAGYMEPQGYQAGGLAQMQQMQQAQRGAAGASRWSPQQQASWRGRQQMQPQRALPQQRAGMMADAQRQQQALQQRAGVAGMQADYQAGQQGLQQRGARPAVMPGGGQTVGGGIPGGPMVPPNMQGYLQKQRMMNRPPSNVGGGVNRVGQQDQQGALSRAMQRGTGRRPMSRRGGFPGRPQ